MKRALAMTAVTVLTAATGLALAAAGPAAHASAKAPIRSYTESSGISLKGVGSKKGYFSGSGGSERVVLSPHLTFSATSYIQRGSTRQSAQVVLVGDDYYVKEGDGSWKKQVYSAAYLADAAQGLNPYNEEQQFGKLPRVRHASATESTVTGTIAQIDPFINDEYGVTVANFKGTGITTLTATLSLDSSGRPVKVVVTGHSSDFDFSVVETFGSFNKPLTITAP
jgi:hypothetical protein